MSVNVLGGPMKAVPSKILQLMDVAKYGVRLPHLKSQWPQLRAGWGRDGGDGNA